jgi:hypothetical protein
MAAGWIDGRYRLAVDGLLAAVGGIGGLAFSLMYQHRRGIS